jgi:hypothetical protein
MDLRRMSILVEVVERGSMRRAARALGLTPSAVSQQIRQLERETGVTLLRLKDHLATTARVSSPAVQRRPPRRAAGAGVDDLESERRALESPPRMALPRGSPIGRAFA